mgnify:CR=1 FL=1
MEFLPEHIARYTENHTQPESAVLAELKRNTQAKVLQPRMLSGHLQGRILSMLSRMVRPHRILEIGTYTGYSAICLAEGLSDKGLLHTIDHNEELEDMARHYFAKAGYEHQIKLHIGEALKIIPTLREKWDMVFIDADKENYLNYYNLLMENMPQGAYLIADNVLWSGKVTEAAAEKDVETRALQAFNEKLQNDDRVENLMLPVRDGLMVARVK